MGELLIFKDIADSLMSNPRDVTLFGERNLVHTGKSSYDVYYYCAGGLWNIKSKEIPYVPFPMLKVQNSHKSLAENKMLAKKLSDFYKKNNCDYAGLCYPGNFSLYRTKAYRTVSGEGDIIVAGTKLIPMDPSVDRCFTPPEKKLSEKLAEQGIDFHSEIKEKIKKIESFIYPAC